MTSGVFTRAAEMFADVDPWPSPAALAEDPVGGPDDVASSEARERTWQWWQHVAAPRLEPDATVIVVMTRWDADDLAGRLIARQPDRWTVVSLPALAEDDDDPLGRRPG